MSIPWDIAFTPDGHAIVPERDSGDIVVRSPGGAVTEISADMSDLNPSGEGGLLGLVVDPDFDQNRRFYTCQTSSSDVQVIAWTPEKLNAQELRQLEGLRDAARRDLPDPGRISAN